MKHALLFLLLSLMVTGFDPAALAQPPVLQRGYDAGVTGANLAEVTLNTSNVTPSTFGLVFTIPVDDNVYAQPLYVPAVAISGAGTHNVLYIATMSDTLDAFDADSGSLLWSTNLADSVGATAVPIARFAFGGNRNIVGNLGILSTPVIDQGTGLLYVVACTLENSQMVYRLHAIDITSGAEPIVPGGTVVSGSFNGSTFDTRGQTQRVSLTIAGDAIIFGFGALEEEGADVGGYVGWVMAYDKHTLAQTGIFATVTSGSRGGGVWQSGRPAVIDAEGYVFAFVGNGFSPYDGVNNFNESALKLDPANGLQLVDWFTPKNWSKMDTDDTDLTSSGPLLIPGTELLAGGGKTGVLYVLDADNLGKESSTDSGVVQEETITSGELRGGPVFWQRSAAHGGSLLYDWGSNDSLKAYAFQGSTFAGSPSDQGGGSQLWPGGTLALSANGDLPGSGVLWATISTGGDANNNPPVTGALLAFDAGNLGTQLWSSTTNYSRDNFGLYAKFVPPLVVGGRVYVATSSNQVAVYGLLSAFSLSPTSLAFGNQLTNNPSSPQVLTVTNTGVTSLPVNGISLAPSGPQPFSQTNTCGGSIAAGANCAIRVVFDPASVGAAAATLSVKLGNGAGTQTVALSGAGIVPTYTVSSASLAFGNQLTNLASAPQSVTMTNTGTVALPITGIALSTPGAQPFAQTNTCSATLAVGASCAIAVTFDPAATGTVAATLRINVGNGAQPQTVALSGNGIVPTYTLSSASLAFGNQLTNMAGAPQSITVTNTGTVALPIAGIALSTPGAQPFSQSNNCGTSVAVGGACTISIVFDPAVAGAATAALDINAGNGGGMQAVALSGTGLEASYTVSPSTVAFGNEPTGVASAPQTVTVTNTGTAALTVTSIALSSSGTQPFSATNTCGTSLAVGAQCVVSVVFDPAAAGQNTGTVSLRLGGIASAINLSGSGTFSTSLSASATSAAAGTPVTLTWSSTAGAVCTASGGAAGDTWSGSLGDLGSQTVTEKSAGTFTYTLNCTDQNVASSANIKVAFTEPSVTISASPTSVTVGSAVTLTWQSSNAASCVASGGVSGDGWAGTKPSSGTATVTPATTGTIGYIITCSSGPDSQQASAQVTSSLVVTAPASKSGGGALDAISLMSLLTLLGLHQGTRRRGQERARPESAPSARVRPAKRKS